MLPSDKPEKAGSSAEGKFLPGSEVSGLNQQLGSDPPPDTFGSETPLGSAADNGGFGMRLTALRKARGLSRGALSEAVLASLKSLQGWEGGQNLPRAEQLLALSRFFDVSIDWLLTGRERHSPAGALTAFGGLFSDADLSTLAWALDFVESQEIHGVSGEKIGDLVLHAAQEFRRASGSPPLPDIDPVRFRGLLNLIEKFEVISRMRGRPASARQRMRKVLGAYSLMQEELDGDGEKPQSPAT